MCLHHATREIPKRDIKCYKVLLKNENDELCSPYSQSTKWKVGEEKFATCVSLLHFENMEKCYDTDIFSGAFHSLPTLELAKKYYKENLSENTFMAGFKKACIVECTIPEDNPIFYVGKTYVGSRPERGYASRYLRIDKIIEEVDLKPMEQRREIQKLRPREVKGC